MNKRQLAVLKRVFTDEINCSKYPTQIKGKTAEELCKGGYLVGTSSFSEEQIPVIIKGYALTHAGRYAYCQSCSDVEEP